MNDNNLTATSLSMMIGIGDHPQIPKFQVGKLRFVQIQSWSHEAITHDHFLFLSVNPMINPMIPYDSQVYMSGWRLSRAAVPAVPAVPAEPVSVEATRRVGAWHVMGPRNRWNECQLDICVYIQHHPTIVWLIICDMWIYLEYHPDIKLIVWHSLQVCINKGGIDVPNHRTFWGIPCFQTKHVWPRW